MGRRKGETYRKEKLKESNMRIQCPNWTINEEILVSVKHVSCELGIKPSRLVEIALIKILIHPTQNLNNPDKLFIKN